MDVFWRIHSLCLGILCSIHQRLLSTVTSFILSHEMCLRYHCMTWSIPFFHAIFVLFLASSGPVERSFLLFDQPSTASSVIRGLDMRKYHRIVSWIVLLYLARQVSVTVPLQHTLHLASSMPGRDYGIIFGYLTKILASCMLSIHFGGGSHVSTISLVLFR